MHRYWGAAILLVTLAACDRTPEPTHGVDTTLNDEDSAAGQDNQLLPATGSPAGYGETLADSRRGTGQSGRRSAQFGSSTENDYVETDEELESTVAEARPPRPVGGPAAYFSSDNYPPAAARAGAQGRVVAMLTIGTDGRVSDCAIETSSGNSDLDDTTCRIARSRIRFSPAIDDSGRTIESSYRLPIRWVLPE